MPRSTKITRSSLQRTWDRYMILYEDAMMYAGIGFQPLADILHRNAYEALEQYFEDMETYINTSLKETLDSSGWKANGDV